MPKSLTASDFQLLGYTTADLTDDGRSWGVFKAHATAGLRTVTDTFIYIKSSASSADERDAVNRANKEPNSHILVPKSRGARVEAIGSQLRRETNFYIYEDLIWQRLESTFAEYLQSLRSEIPRPDPFVTPRNDNDSHEDVLRSTIEFLTGREQGNQLLALLAPAGVGKTTLTRELSARLAEQAGNNRLIPVYVESSHWRQAQLDLERTDDLWDVVYNSLSQFAPAITLTRTLYDHLLNSGDIAFIFDGFDELCGERYAPFSPREVVRQLADLASTSGARIMLTTRTEFWNAEFEATPENVRTKTLAPFTKQQAHNYLQRRFKDNKGQFNASRQLLGRVRADNQPASSGGGKNQITYHPYVVELVASAAERDAELDANDHEVTVGGRPNIMLSILYSMCERERLRQGLKTSAQQQLAGMQDLAIEQLSTGDNSFSVDVIEAAGFDVVDLEKVKSHPLFRQIGALPHGREEGYEFRYEFLPYLLGAKSIIETVERFKDSKSSAAPNRQIIDLMERHCEGSSQLFDHIRSNWPANLPIASLVNVYDAVGKQRNRTCSFFIHLCRAAIQLEGDDRAERAQIILGTFGDVGENDHGLVVKGLWIQGTLDRLDLRHVRFEKCVFQNAVFQSCIASHDTIFRSCSFFGAFQVAGRDKKTWVDVQVAGDTEMDSLARVSWEELQPGGSGNRSEFLNDILELGLKKFWRHGRLRKRILKQDWPKGILGELQMAQEVANTLIRVGLIYEVAAAGARQQSYEFNTEALGDLQRFMDNRQRTGRVLDAYRELGSG